VTGLRPNLLKYKDIFERLGLLRYKGRTFDQKTPKRLTYKGFFVYHSQLRFLR